MLCEPIIVSSTYIFILSIFSSSSLFPVLSILPLLEAKDRSVDAKLIFILPMFFLIVIAIVYYFKLYKEVKLKVGYLQIIKKSYVS